MRKTLSITRLYLDSKNPRHIPIENQKEIIAFLIENEKIKPLAKDIAEKGLINPLDLVGITEENKKKIVLEGNRRICALKLLLNPLLAPKKHQKYFNNLKQKIDTPIKKIEVHQFKSRLEAQPWLSTLHSASSDTARKSWSTEQQTRFEQEVDGKPDHAAALTILEFSLQNKFIQPEQSTKVITTITRMLSTPEVREAFGILTGVRERNIKINIRLEEFKEILRQYFNDFDNKTHNIGSRSNKEDRLRYLEYLKSLGKIPSSYLSEEIELLPGIISTTNSAVTKEPSSNKNQSRNSTYKKKQNGLIDYELKIPVSKIESVYLELKTKLKVAETPYAVAALLRALVEQSCDYFLIKNRSIQFHENGRSEKVKENSILRVKILGIAQKLGELEYLESKELSTLINECQPNRDVGTLSLLNNVLHNYAHNITFEQSIAAHNNLKPLIIAIWNKYPWPNEE
ncbi:hypothetical protein P9057_09830 [Gallibacterium anatis]|uniref:hypothetical protein n=2 Tax=Gallibacterium anatis TaxID=750 RepID=UPI00068B1C36|nr:hypothetical protein [Gallibacterium anatis]WIM82831.1 hypothetical protein QP019_04060 [Gallibacterium anatis]